MTIEKQKSSINKENVGVNIDTQNKKASTLKRMVWQDWIRIGFLPTISIGTIMLMTDSVPQKCVR